MLHSHASHTIAQQNFGHASLATTTIHDAEPPADWREATQPDMERPANGERLTSRSCRHHAMASAA
jgi:hypothetical protein